MCLPWERDGHFGHRVTAVSGLLTAVIDGPGACLRQFVQDRHLVDVDVPQTTHEVLGHRKTWREIRGKSLSETDK